MQQRPLVPADHGKGQMADPAVAENPANLAPEEPDAGPYVDKPVHSQLPGSCPCREPPWAAAHGACAAAALDAAASASAGVSGHAANQCGCGLHCVLVPLMLAWSQAAAAVLEASYGHF